MMSAALHHVDDFRLRRTIPEHQADGDLKPKVIVFDAHAGSRSTSTALLVITSVIIAGCELEMRVDAQQAE
ncbi:hypothetical protein F2P81_007341 [Scophthalmus maximus]|uniref:Uncharacterized protein n=1 Tax=Scophthalmus maximus TaxID=52904 RepID=A0A6A4T622_SCOMX|nr:hypothetical protein F2P81_007341 [Scophthalmus maximus]